MKAALSEKQKNLSVICVSVIYNRVHACVCISYPLGVSLSKKLGLFRIAARAIIPIASALGNVSRPTDF
jgi:hypothetical protein